MIFCYFFFSFYNSLFPFCLLIHRLAVEEWIQSEFPIHIVRDHVNHCHRISGGLWGGTKGAIQDMQKKFMNLDRNLYMADIHFLHRTIYPAIKDKQIAHDSYCCERYPNTRPFPTQRYPNYQHVGQVFSEFNEPRMSDIDGLIRDVTNPVECRKQSDWIYG
jgi:hypothetical protein